jgi:LacI family transcriptional regulator
MTTLRDVAKLAKVSTCTASKVLSGDTKSRFRPDTADAVRAAAKKLGWTPDHRARSLRTGKAGAIALITPGVSDSPFANALIAAADAVLRPTGTSLIMAGGSKVHGSLATATRLAEERRVDGLLVMSWGLLPEHLTILDSLSLPFVIIGNHNLGGHLTTAQLDDAAGIAAAIEHLGRLGHRRIAWVGPTRGGKHDLIANRRRAVHQFGVAAGMTVDDIAVEVPETPSPDNMTEVSATFSAVTAALRSGCEATALVCYNDLEANASLYALHASGRRIPEDISVIGFDDVLASIAWPALTTISHELAALMQASVGMVLDTSLPRQALITPRLVVRASTGPARA